MEKSKDGPDVWHFVWQDLNKQLASYGISIALKVGYSTGYYRIFKIIALQTVTVMAQKASLILGIIASLLLETPAIADDDPWFVGPLIALSGQALPKGQTNFEFYSFYAPSYGIYNRDWAPTQFPKYVNTQFIPEISYGMMDHMDIELDPTYVINQNQHETGSNMGDTTLILGLQLLDQGTSRLGSDLKLTLQETFPTGIYDHLDPNNIGTDGTGAGSYQTGIGINIQHLSKFKDNHYVNSHLCFTYIHTSPVDLNGYSVYGGTPATKGVINPGHMFSIDAAAEVSLTQNWVAVMEGFFQYQLASSFEGFIGDQVNGIPVIEIKGRRRLLFLFPSRHNIGRDDIGSGNSDMFTLAPALEYNFSENYGLIGGAWFTVIGKNTPSFTSYALAFNASW